MKSIHKVRDHKRKTKFDVGNYHFFLSWGMLLFTLAESGALIIMSTFFHYYTPHKHSLGGGGYKYMELQKKDNHNLSSNKQRKIYREIYSDIVHTAKEGHSIRICTILTDGCEKSCFSILYVICWDGLSAWNKKK